MFFKLIDCINKVAIFECQINSFKYQVVLKEMSFSLKRFDCCDLDIRKTLVSFYYKKTEQFETRLIDLAINENTERLEQTKNRQEVIPNEKFGLKYIQTYFYKEKSIFENVFFLIFLDEYVLPPQDYLSFPNDVKVEITELLELFRDNFKKNSYLCNFLLQRMYLFRYFSFSQNLQKAYSDNIFSELVDYKMKLLDSEYFERIPTRKLASGKITWFPRLDQEFEKIDEFIAKCDVR